MNEQPTTTSDDRTLAALSHFFGLLVAAIVWATQKDKSRLIRFQAMQAIFFDLITMVASFVFVGCFILVIMGVMLVSMFSITAAAQSPSPDTTFGWIFSLMFSFPFLIALPAMLFGFSLTFIRIFAAVRVFMGKDFRYPWLGNWVERFLENG